MKIICNDKARCACVVIKVTSWCVTNQTRVWLGCHKTAGFPSCWFMRFRFSLVCLHPAPASTGDSSCYKSVLQRFISAHNKDRVCNG